MKFTELVRLLDSDGFQVVKERAPYGITLNQVGTGSSGSTTMGTRRCLLAPVAPFSRQQAEQQQHTQGVKIMLDLPCSLIIEATEEPDYFGFYSPELEGFTGVGHSVEDCLYKAKWGMKEHVALLKEQGLPISPRNPDPIITIQNEHKAA
jgi:predicted RNase H-like HicB family nuclease